MPGRSGQKIDAGGNETCQQALGPGGLDDLQAAAELRKEFDTFGSDTPIFARGVRQDLSV